MPSTPPTVLVTGATGIVGRHTVRELMERGASIHAVARDSLDTVDLGDAECHRLDLLDRTATQLLVDGIKPDILIHLAWITGHGRFWNAPENLDWLASSIYLVRAFAESGGNRMVIAGTCAEYDAQNPIGVPVAENTPCNPATLYGWAKHGLREVLTAFAAEAGISCAWGRLFLLYGEEEPEQRLAPSVIKALLKAQPAQCSSGKQVRDFMDTRDAGRAFAELALSNVQGPVNVCNGQAISVAQFASRIASIIGREDLLRLGALPDRPNDPPYLVGDPARLHDEVGFTPSITLEQGLTDAIDRFRRTSGGRQ